MEAKAENFSEYPIAVFDSGVGGLTVLRRMRELLPAESFIYLGDTARLPYGTKSPETITRYALMATAALAKHKIKMLVVACNTASAVALPALRQACRDITVIGVVEPGARAACAASATKRIAVIATESTIRGKAYEISILRHAPKAIVISQACPLFVPMAEDGLADGPLAEGLAARYLDKIFAGPRMAGQQIPDCLVLGCTHFPLLSKAIGAVIGPNVTLVDSAETTALDVQESLTSAGLLSKKEQGTLQFMTTDDVERFARMGESFLGLPLDFASVNLVDL